MANPSLAAVARFAVAFATALALAAVLLNFLLARGRDRIKSERRSPVATATMLGFFAGLYLILRFHLGEVPVPAGVVGAGLALLGAGTLFNLMGRFNLGGNWGDHVVIYQDHTFVARGAYRWVRHPLYASLIWMASGASLILGNPVALAAVLGIFLPAMVYRARQEEAALIETFPGYAAYRRVTGMFLPTPWLK
jgi:protein-S-isoprenylcysteine O-methyltransferase Ste14